MALMLLKQLRGMQQQRVRSSRLRATQNRCTISFMNIPHLHSSIHRLAGIQASQQHGQVGTMAYIDLVLPEVNLLAAYRFMATLLFNCIQLICNLGSSCHTAYISPQLCVPLVYQHSCVKPSLRPLLIRNPIHTIITSTPCIQQS